jgi:hypothetical protein
MEIRHTQLIGNDIKVINRLINYLNILTQALHLQVKNQEDFMYQVCSEPREDEKAEIQEVRIEKEKGENILRIVSNIVNAYLERKELKEPVYEHIKELMTIFDMIETPDMSEEIV